MNTIFISPSKILAVWQAVTHCGHNSDTTGHPENQNGSLRGLVYSAGWISLSSKCHKKNHVSISEHSCQRDGVLSGLLDLPCAEERKPHACGASIPSPLPLFPQKKPRPLHGICSFSCQGLLSRPLVSHLPSLAKATKESPALPIPGYKKGIPSTLMLNPPIPASTPECLEIGLLWQVCISEAITLE